MAAIVLSDVSLRSLKNALQDQFPLIKSSHLSEALACALGFKTNAALRAGFASSANKNITLKDAGFLKRLQDLGHSVGPGFSFDVFLQSKPSEFRLAIERILELEAVPKPNWQEIYALRRRSAQLFAEEFGLGTAYQRFPEKDESAVQLWDAGIDYSACQPGWGRLINSNASIVQFPGSKHVWRFYQRLPLSGGKYVEYCCAQASMPYIGKEDPSIPDIEEARAYATKLGWSCSVHLDKAWYAVGSTALVLFQRTTSHAEMRKMWDASFKRWLIENQARVSKGMRAPKRYVVTDIIECRSFPLDVRNFDECCERYLQEYVPRLLYNDKDVMLKTFKNLFEQWEATQAGQG